MYTKDIVCLPPTAGPALTTSMPIPRGEKRAQLAEIGLIGKVSINAAWKAGEVQREISSVFASAFALQSEDILPFEYLR